MIPIPIPNSNSPIKEVNTPLLIDFLHNDYFYLTSNINYSKSLLN